MRLLDAAARVVLEGEAVVVLVVVVGGRVVVVVVEAVLVAAVDAVGDVVDDEIGCVGVLVDLVSSGFIRGLLVVVVVLVVLVVVVVVVVITIGSA